MSPSRSGSTRSNRSRSTAGSPPRSPEVARHRPVATLLAVAFVVVPVVEIYLLIQVGQVIGGWQTVALLLLTGFLGGWLVRREGGRAWQALREALREGRMPGRELADAGLVLVGGTLLITPGFVSDVVGLFAVLPPTRPLARRLLSKVVTDRVGARVDLLAHPRPGEDPARGPVVRGDVVD